MNFFTLTFEALGRNHKEHKPLHSNSLCFVLIKQSDSSGSIGSRMIILYIIRSNFSSTLEKFCVIIYINQLINSKNFPSFDSPFSNFINIRLTSNTTRIILSQEPTFLPKVQIHFADFPYLHCSNWPEAANLGNLLRFTVRFRSQIRFILKIIYSPE